MPEFIQAQNLIISQPWMCGHGAVYPLKYHQ